MALIHRARYACQKSSLASHRNHSAAITHYLAEPIQTPVTFLPYHRKIFACPTILPSTDLVNTLVAVLGPVAIDLKETWHQLIVLSASRCCVRPWCEVHATRLQVTSLPATDPVANVRRPHSLPLPSEGACPIPLPGNLQKSHQLDTAFGRLFSVCGEDFYFWCCCRWVIFLTSRLTTF